MRLALISKNGNFAIGRFVPCNLGRPPKIGLAYVGFKPSVYVPKSLEAKDFRGLAVDYYRDAAQKMNFDTSFAKYSRNAFAVVSTKTL